MCCLCLFPEAWPELARPIVFVCVCVCGLAALRFLDSLTFLENATSCDSQEEHVPVIWFLLYSICFRPSLCLSVGPFACASKLRVYAALSVVGWLGNIVSEGLVELSQSTLPTLVGNMVRLV